MKIEKISSNVMRVSEKVSNDEYAVNYVTAEGVTIAIIAIDHAKRIMDMSLNVDALKYPSTLLAIANFLGINSVFLKSNGISVPNCYGYKITVKHEKFN